MTLLRHRSEFVILLKGKSETESENERGAVKNGGRRPP